MPRGTTLVGLQQATSAGHHHARSPVTVGLRPLLLTWGVHPPYPRTPVPGKARPRDFGGYPYAFGRRLKGDLPGDSGAGLAPASGSLGQEWFPVLSFSSSVAILQTMVAPMRAGVKRLSRAGCGPEGDANSLPPSHRRRVHLPSRCALSVERGPPLAPAASHCPPPPVQTGWGR